MDDRCRGRIATRCRDDRLAARTHDAGGAPTRPAALRGITADRAVAIGSPEEQGVCHAG
jgi:hypothetical protein